MKRQWGGKAAVVAGCAAIFWPGAFIFGFPGVMAQHWQATMGVSRAAVGQTMFFVLAAVGLFLFLSGRFQQKLGHSRLAAAGAIICGLSALMVSQASSMGMVYVFAFFMGVSSTFIYIPALTVVQNWFPGRRGLVSGLVNQVFGVSAAVMSPVFSALLVRVGYEMATISTALIGLAMALVAAPFIRMPPAPISSPPAQTGRTPALGASLTVTQAVRQRSFWALWLVGAMVGAGGISLVTLSIPFGLSRGLSLNQAVIILTAFNVTNGCSRLITGYLSDFLDRNLTMSVTFVAGGLAYLLWLHLDGLVAWVILAAVIGFAFGTLFAVAAPLASDCFGLEHFGTIFGLAFTAYGFGAGALGPWLCGYILDITQENYQLVFNYLGTLFLLSAGLILLVRPKRLAHAE